MNHSELSHMAGAVDDSTINIVVVIIIIIILFAVQRFPNFSAECRNFVIAKTRHYRYHGITASNLLSPRYYRESFSIPAVITVVTALLPLSQLSCHPLLQCYKSA